MARRKLDENKRKLLRKALKAKLVNKGDRSTFSVFKELARRFRITPEAVRYYASGPRKRNGRRPNGKSASRAVNVLLDKAREHRKLSRDLMAKHTKIAKEYEKTAQKLLQLER
jgi:hypothetical protein